MKEEQLIKLYRTKKGQKLLFDTYYHLMYSVALRYVRVKEDAQDVISEAFVRIFRGIENFEPRGNGSLVKWVKTIVINESLRFLNKNRKLIFSDDMNEADAEFTEDIEGNIDLEYLMKVVNNLPDGYRIVFLMYVVEGFSHKEIAEKLRISISTSKSQLFKARNLLVKKLKIDKYETFRN